MLVSIPIAGRCTNIRAELIAAAYALRVCAKLRRDFPGHRIEFQSDSQHVLQILSDAIVTTANLAEVCQLRSAWEPVRDFLRISHVRAHTGEPLNELADSSAKYAATFSHNKVLTA